MCGYIDLDTQRMVISRRFQKALQFREGLASVRIKGQYGFIDVSGREAIKPQFDAAGKFYHGLAEVVVEAKAGVIGRDGKFRVRPQFARAIPFDRNVILTREGKWHHSQGPEPLAGLDSHALISGSPFGLYHVETGWIVKPSLKLQPFTRDATGLIWAAKISQKSLKGLIRSDGTWQVEPRFSHVQSLNEGIAVVAVKDQTGQKSQRWGAVDAEGKIIVPLIYDHVAYWNHGYGLARKDGKNGLLDRTGQLVGGRFFDKVERATEKRFARVLLDGKWMSVTGKGKLIPDQREGEIILSCPSGLTLKRESDRVAFYKPDGKRVSEALFKLRGYAKKDCRAPLTVTSEGKWGFITLDGRLLHDPLKFESQIRFKGGKAWVQFSGLWGQINDTGEFIIPPQFESLQRHGPDHYRVKKDGVEFFIDATGQRITQPPEFKRHPSAFLKCSGGGRLVSEKNKWGMVDPEGKMIIPVRHRALSCFMHGIAWAPIDEKKAWCPIGSDGRFHSSPACKTRYYPYWASHSSPEKFSDDPFESNVLWVIAYLEYGAGKRSELPKWVPGRQRRSHTGR